MTPRLDERTLSERIFDVFALAVLIVSALVFLSGISDPQATGPSRSVDDGWAR